MINSINKKIEKLILPNSKMLEVYNKLYKEKFKFPYFFEVKAKNQTLYFLGVQHTTEPKNHQIKKINSLWKSFLAKSNRSKCIVMLEGGIRPIAANEVEAISKYGEPGLITYLASRENLNYVSPEPDEKWEIEQLLKAFTKEEAIYYYFARALDSYFRHQSYQNQEKLNERLDRFFKEYKKNTGWIDFDFSLEVFKKIHNKLHDHPFSFKDTKCFENDSHPAKNRVAAKSSIIRNIHIASLIIDAWEEGKNIFVVYGSGHAIVLEPALKELLK